MNDDRVEAYVLELCVLQVKDTEMAKNEGFTSKESWFEYLSKQKDDEISRALNDVALRYEIPLKRVAYDFDPTAEMYERVLRNQQTNSLKNDL